MACTGMMEHESKMLHPKVKDVSQLILRLETFKSRIFGEDLAFIGRIFTPFLLPNLLGGAGAQAGH